MLLSNLIQNCIHLSSKPTIMLFSCFIHSLTVQGKRREGDKRGVQRFPNEQLPVLHMLISCEGCIVAEISFFFFFFGHYSHLQPNYKHGVLISVNRAPHLHPSARLCPSVHAPTAAWMFTSVWGWENRPRLKGGRAMMLRGERKGREGSVQRGERARERGKKKKKKATGKGETRRTQPLPIDAGGFSSRAPRSADTERWSQ